MTTTIEYLDQIKAKTGITSDYGLHKLLGTSKTTISNYRNGHNYFDDDMCLKVASILGLPDIEVVLNVHAERSQNPIIKASFSDVLKRIATTAAMCLFVTGLNLLQPAPALASAGFEGGPGNIHYAKTKRRRGRPAKAVKIDLSFLVKNLIKSS